MPPSFDMDITKSQRTVHYYTGRQWIARTFKAPESTSLFVQLSFQDGANTSTQFRLTDSDGDIVAGGFVNGQGTFNLIAGLHIQPGEVHTLEIRNRYGEAGARTDEQIRVMRQ